eukprot:Pgem_evm1s17493
MFVSIFQNLLLLLTIFDNAHVKAEEYCHCSDYFEVKENVLILESSITTEL